MGKDNFGKEPIHPKRKHFVNEGLVREEREELMGGQRRRRGKRVADIIADDVGDHHFPC